MATRSMFEWHPLSGQARFVEETADGTGESGTDSGDGVKADGANLFLGSSEYRERLRDRAGMSELEQERVKLADQGAIIESKKVSTETDTKLHDDYQQSLKDDAAELTSLYNDCETELEMEAAESTPQANNRFNGDGHDIHETASEAAYHRLKDGLKQSISKQTKPREEKRDEPVTPLSSRMERYGF